MKKQSKVARILMLAISATCIALGLTALITGFVPERWTRFGLTAALFGSKAKLYGGILLIVSLVPLLIFCKTSKQAATLGSILFLLIITAIFGGLYLVN